MPAAPPQVPVWSDALEIEVPGDDRRAQRVHVRGGPLRPFDALGTGQQVLLYLRKLRLFNDHSKVVPFQVVDRKMCSMPIQCRGGRNILKNILGVRRRRQTAPVRYVNRRDVRRRQSKMGYPAGEVTNPSLF